MRPAREILTSGLVLADGAMGTWFAQLSGGDAAGCEQANLTDPDLVRLIHRQYLAAGARLLRTNTFAAAAIAGPGQTDLLRRLIRTGYGLAAECAGDLAFVAADIGPAYTPDADNSLSGCLQAAETFLECAADLFILETFADPAELLPVCRQIKIWRPEAVVIASFALSPDGLTRKGIPLAEVADIMENSPEIDIWGLNCGIGPTHLAEQAAPPGAGRQTPFTDAKQRLSPPGESAPGLWERSGLFRENRRRPGRRPRAPAGRLLRHDAAPYRGPGSGLAPNPRPRDGRRRPADQPIRAAGTRKTRKNRTFGGENRRRCFHGYLRT